MNMKFCTGFLAVLALSIQLTAAKAAGPQEDPYPEIVLPVYQDAYDIKKTASRMEGSKTLTYKIQTRYPAAEVVEFYDAALNPRGWKPTFEICQRHWDCPDGEISKKGMQTRQFFTSWHHPRYKMQLSLLMKYHGPGKAGRDEVIVQCRLYPRQ